MPVTWTSLSFLPYQLHSFDPSSEYVISLYFNKNKPDSTCNWFLFEDVEDIALYATQSGLFM